MEQRYSRNDNVIRRKFYQYLFPTVLMVLAMQFGSLAESIIIGNMLGEDALSASSLALPAVLLCQFPAILIGTGAGIVGANYIGKREVEKASRTFKMALLAGFLVSLIFIPVGLFAADPAARAIAGNFPELAPMISQYMQMYAYQAPLIALGIAFAYFLPSDNNPSLGAAFFIVLNVVHLGVLVAFCATLPLQYAMYGVGGSMGIGFLAAFIVLIPYIKSKTRTIDLTVSIKGGWKEVVPFLKAGSAAGVLTLLSFVYYLIMNLSATAFLTEAEVPVFAMMSNFAFVIDLVVLGILQVMPSVVSSLYGEKDFYGVKVVVRRVFIIALSAAGVLTLISMIYPQLFFYMFGVDLATAMTGPNDPLLVVRLYCASFLIYTVNRFLVTYYPSILINPPALFGNIIRIGLIGPLALFFFMMAFGAIGDAYGALLMEGATLLAMLVFLYFYKRKKGLKEKGLLLLPESGGDYPRIDLSIPSEESEVSLVVEQLQQTAEELCNDKKAAALLALASEEIIANTIAYGYKRKHSSRYIDVNLSRNEDCLLVRIRDDGVAFDPTVYQLDEEGMRYHGIEVIRKVAKGFRYFRLLNTNNTIMEIPISQGGENHDI